LRDAVIVEPHDGNHRLARRLHIILDEEVRPPLPMEGEGVRVEPAGGVGQDFPAHAEPAGFRHARPVVEAVADAPVCMVEARPPQGFPGEAWQCTRQIGGEEPGPVFLESARLCQSRKPALGKGVHDGKKQRHGAGEHILDAERCRLPPVDHRQCAPHNRAPVENCFDGRQIADRD
jgi:hypothetical protein